jgi:hypothetical protein
MYKINTNQILTPFSKLNLPHDRDTETFPSTTPSPPSTPTSSPASPIESEEVQNIVFGTGPVGPLLPTPLLLPTSYSSRLITTTKELPSSPPPVASPTKSAGSPAKSAGMRTPLAQSRFGSPEKDGDLTSSVVKGRAASGLLKLMAGR